MKLAFDSQMDTITLSEAGVELTIKTVDRKSDLTIGGKPFKVKLLGPDSASYRAQLDASNRRAMADAEHRQKFPNEPDRDRTEDALDFLAALTVSWSDHLVDAAGKPVQFNVANAKAMYKAYPDIRDQVDNFVAKRANFLPPSSKA
jgi:hypothetical protein